MSWSHEDLVEDLTLNRWESGEIAAREASLGAWGDSGRADVASIKPSWANPVPTIYEVKVSRADLLSDLRSEKWQRYLPWVDRFYFAAPKGVAKRDEIPDPAGLMLRGPNGWYSVKAPKIQQGDPSEGTFFMLAMAILMRYYPAPWDCPHPSRYVRVRELARGRRGRQVLGDEIAKRLSEANRNKAAVEHHRSFMDLIQNYCPREVRWKGTEATLEWVAKALGSYRRQ